jgi:hypothetical protein
VERRIIPTALIDALIVEIDASEAAETAHEATTKGTTDRPATRHSRPRTPPGDNRVTRCRAYLKKVGPAVSGQRGHDRTYMVARLIWNDFAVDEAEGYPLLEEFNQSCPPDDRWTDKELRHKWDDAVRAGPDNRGSKLGDRQGNTPPGGSGRCPATPPPGGSSGGMPASAAGRPNDESNDPHRLANEFMQVVSPDHQSPQGCRTTQVL